MSYFFHLVALTSVYGILAIGQYVIWTRGGMLLAVQAALFAIGAYSAALSSIAGVPSILALAVGSLASLLFSLPLGLPIFRLRGDYLLVASLGFCEIVRSLLNNLRVTGGAAGLMNVPTLRVGSVTISGPMDFAFLSVAILCVLLFANRRLEDSPFGRLLFAIGEDASAAEGLGKDLRRARLTAIAFSAAWAGLAGGIWAFYVHYLDPSGFSLWESVLILAMVVAGGSAGVFGVLLGCLLMLVVPELLRFSGLAQSIGGPLRQILFGIILVAAGRRRSPAANA